MFLEKWNIKHTLSSVSHPQSNGRAELSVKTAKRLIRDNVRNNGSLNMDKLSAALLQYRNTPLQGIGLSPAQLLFHRDLKDFLPALPNNHALHCSWDELAKAREREHMLKRIKRC